MDYLAMIAITDHLATGAEGPFAKHLANAWRNANDDEMLALEQAFSRLFKSTAVKLINQKKGEIK